MTDYVKAMRDERNPYHGEAKRLAAKLETGTTIGRNGILRWNSNGRVPFDDVILLAMEIGLPVDREASAKARDEDNTAFLADYRERMKNYKPSAEERAEMRAAFGPGTTVVNVITGRRTKL